MELTDEENEVLKRILAMVMKKPRDKLVVSPKDMGSLEAVLGKLEPRRPTIREARELRRKAQEDAEAKKD
jgi:hypothetical protein